MSLKRASYLNRYTPLRSKAIHLKGSTAWNTQRDPGRDDSYRNWIRFLPCVVCYKNWPLNPEIASLIVEAAELGTLPLSECAHVGVRGFGQKCSDRQTLPLCTEHHRTGKDAGHAIGKRFWGVHGLDRDALIRSLIELYPLKTT